MSNEKEKLWSEIARMRTCMLVTIGADGPRARPMAPMHDAAQNKIRFIARGSDYKDNEIETNPRVCLVYADTSDNTYASVTGEARVLRDQASVHAHWSDGADPWFEDGKDDPDAIVIEVDPAQGEYWDTTSSDVLVALKIATAAAQGKHPDFGDNEKVAL